MVASFIMSLWPITTDITQELNVSYRGTTDMHEASTKRIGSQ